ncbi:MAG: hypothetical protein ACRD3Q_04970, partial [Terriglobales bacterium]
LDRLSVLRDIALVLDVSLAALIGDEEPASAKYTFKTPDVDALENALLSYSAIQQPENLGGITKTQLACQVKHAWTLFQAASLSPKCSTLPNLLTHLHQQKQSLYALRLLVFSYQLACEVAFKLGRPDLAWIAADRGIQFAELSEDLALIGGANRRIVHAMMLGSNYTRGLALVTATAQRLAPAVSASSPDIVSACGALLLKGSIAAAKAKNVSVAIGLNDEAARIAAVLGKDRNIHWSAFGPTNVVIHRATAMTELNDGPGALAALSTIDRKALDQLSAERRAEYFLTSARGHLLSSNTQGAVRAVMEADRVGPGSVRFRPSSRHLIHQLIHGPGRPSSDPMLLRLARLVGIQT